MLLLQTRNQVTDSFRSKYVVIPIVDISLLNSLIRILHHDQQLMTHMNFLLSIIRTISVLTFLSKEKTDRCNNWDSLRIQIYRWKSMPTSGGWFCFIICDVGLPVKGSFPNEQGSSNHSDTNSRTAAYRNRKFGWPTKRSIFIKRSIQERTQPL